jgi:hypothetical protein
MKIVTASEERPHVYGSSAQWRVRRYVVADVSYCFSAPRSTSATTVESSGGLPGDGAHAGAAQDQLCAEQPATHDCPDVASPVSKTLRPALTTWCHRPITGAVFPEIDTLHFRAGLFAPHAI